MHTQNKTFIFQGYDAQIEKGEVAFHYRLRLENKELIFTEKISFSPVSINIPQELLKNILNNVFLILGISYWKLYCPKNIEIVPFNLTEEQAKFWNIVYTKGLGEFFYKNHIDYRGLIEFPFEGNPSRPIGSEPQGRRPIGHSSPLRRGQREVENMQKRSNTIAVLPRKDRSLLLIGGGKDSIVSGELLKKYNKPFAAFVVNDHLIRERTIQLLDTEKLLMKRIFDPLLFSLNKQEGTYNGHVPVSSQYAFLSLFAACLYDYRYIIASNEKSANYGNVEYLGKEINHQWSKSEEFEKLFQDYVKTYITSDIIYFSLLRPLNEIEITKLFSSYPKYFSVFSSCNTNFKITGKKQKQRWCGTCAKCCFVFTMLATFLPKETVLDIFEKNLFEDKTLIPLFRELLGLGEVKPFECVGTPEEMRYAMYLIDKKEEFSATLVLRMCKKEAMISEIEEKKLEKELFSTNEHSIPEEFLGFLSF